MDLPILILVAGAVAAVLACPRMAAAALRRYTGQGLKPAIYPETWKTDAVRFAPGTYVVGTVVGQGSTLTAAADVQTITVTATGGTFRLQDPTSGLVTAALAYNVTSAALQTALELIYGAGNVAVTGGAGATAPLVVTFQAGAGAMPQQLLVVYSNNVTGGAATVVPVHTTTGRMAGGTWGAYDDAATDGRQVAKGALVYALTVDNNGFHTAGGGEFGSRQLSAPVVIGGYVRTADLTGLDAAAIADLGRIVRGDAGNLSNTGTILKIN